MALLRVTGLGGLKQAQPFSENWQAQLKGTQELWHNCGINIYKEVRGKFDPVTGETPVTEELVYSGRARVQPVRASRDVNVVDDRTTQQVARFQISDTSINLTPDMWVRVTETRGPAIGTNTYPTPSFELPGSPFVLATNLCPNPTATADGALLGTPGGAAQFQTQGVTIPATANGTTTAAEMTNQTSTTWITSRAAVDGLVGDTTPRTVTMLVRNPNAVDIQASLRTASQANVWTTIPAGETRTISRAVDAELLFYVRRDVGPAALGDKVQWTDITTADDFFTGDTPDEGDLVYTWDGPPYNSPSTLSGVRALGVNDAGYQSTQWSASGSHSLRLLEGESADIGTGPLQFKARALGQLYTVDSVPHIAVEGVNRVESGLVSLGEGWWDDVSTAETWFYPPSGDGSVWSGTPDSSSSVLYSVIPGSTLNPSLSRYRFKLREVVDSGNLIERTFEAVMDNESQTS